MGRLLVIARRACGLRGIPGIWSVGLGAAWLRFRRCGASVLALESDEGAGGLAACFCGSAFILHGLDESVDGGGEDEVEGRGSAERGKAAEPGDFLCGLGPGEDFFEFGEGDVEARDDLVGGSAKGVEIEDDGRDIARVEALAEGAYRSVGRQRWDVHVRRILRNRVKASGK